MLIFQKIRFKNFLSYGSTFTEIQLDKTHTTLLHGDSGSGKSTVLDAISYVLFNRPFRDINKPLLVNTVNGKDCMVEIEFQLGSLFYWIKRGIKPNVFEIYKQSPNGSWILVNQDAHSRDYQEYLEKAILGFNYKTFSQVVVLGAANFTPFMQLKPNDRRAIVEELLDIKIFSVMNILLKQRLSDIKTELSNNDSRISNVKEKAELVKKFSEELRNTLEENIRKNNEKIYELELQRRDLEKELDVLETRIRSGKNSLLEKKKKLLEKREGFLQIQNELQSNINRNKKQLKFLQDHDECQTCGQEITQDFKEYEKQKREKKVDELTSALNGMVSKQLTAIVDKISLLDSSIKEYDGPEEETRAKRNQHYGTTQLMEHLLSEVKDFQKELETKFSGTNSNQELIELENALKKLIEQKESLLEQRLVGEVASNLLRDGGIKSLIIKQYLPHINKFVNRFLNTMNFYIKFTVDENFVETIQVRGNDEFTYFSFSEGEKQRLDLALLFTWRSIAKLKNSVNTNLLILDELLDSYLDQAATENVIELLNSDLFRDNNIFIISHKDTILDKFERCLNFKKVKGFSRIV